MFYLLLTLHLIGFAMGLSVSFANIVLGIVIPTLAPSEIPVLMKFPPKMARVGDIGLVLVLITGPIMLFMKYRSLSGLPWYFHVKLAAVVVLVAAVGAIHMNSRKAFSGDKAALARGQALGKVTFVSSITAVVFAVLSFAR